MLTPEETKVLTYLRKHLNAAAADVARSCGGGGPGGWLGRVFSNLDWFGYVTVFYGRAGEPIAVQITDKGLGRR